MKPRMFIASSVDNLDLAYAAQEGLEHDVEPTVWSQGVFKLSRSAMSSLMDVLDESDFGLFVFAPSDITTIKDSEKQTVRDNVIFELGLFLGRLGAERCFILTPRDVDDLHLPTDLTGITTASYDPNRRDNNLVAALGPACNNIRKAITRQGFKEIETTNAVESSAADPKPQLTDPEDIKSVMQTWLGTRSSADLRKAFYYAELDKRLNIPAGSTKMYIEEVMKRWHYVAERKGNETIIFRQVPLQQRRRTGYIGGF